MRAAWGPTKADNHFATHKWYAILLSESGSFAGTSASIKNSFVVREHFERAAALSPKDATSRHLLGLWCFEVAKLSWIEQKAAAALFATPPTATFAEALDHFEHAERIEPGFYPKNLPLGWDGRPIPYWLYKLHGLDQEFKCEICGDASYWGRRAFDQHFNEWRHSHGMRCLRIPNSAHFHGVTKMDDAVALWEQLQERHEAEAFKAERDEEYEDSDGNVLNRATYEDLARQGML